MGERVRQQRGSAKLWPMRASIAAVAPPCAGRCARFFLRRGFALRRRQRWPGVASASLRLWMIGRIVFHRTIVKSRFQRTAHGQRQNIQACSPSAMEKKIIWARPIKFSSGT